MISKKLLFIALTTVLSSSAHAATIGILGTYGNNYSSELTTLGNTVKYLNSSSLDSSNLTGIDTVLMLRDTSSTPDLTRWINNGGTLITEWSSAYYGGSLLNANINSNYSTYRTNDSIVFTSSAGTTGITNNIGSSYSASVGTEFFQDFFTTGTGTILATRGSNNAVAILGGKVGNGYVYINGYDWADNLSANTANLLNNQANLSIAAVPEPETYALMMVGITGLILRSLNNQKTSKKLISC